MRDVGFVNVPCLVSHGRRYGFVGDGVRWRVMSSRWPSRLSVRMVAVDIAGGVDGDASREEAASALAYDHRVVERRWQEFWERNQTFQTPRNVDMSRPKFYALDMFPYPSGAGLHVGHPEGYTATDIMARYKRHRGFNVMHPMGWDAFGLPAEQYALQTGTHPAVTTEKNVNRFRQQLQSLGFSYDWTREVSTTDPSYYKWTQWIFLKLFEKGLAYQADVPVNWCPELGTVLANEEVIDGKSERGGFPVERRPMRQWILRITEYAERLLNDLEDLDWPESIKEMQRNWIGKSEGAELSFQVHGSETGQKLTVFTTRPETIAGVTYLCVAPEFEGLEGLVTPETQEAVFAYCEKAKNKSDRERTGEGVQKIKTGVPTGSSAVNPLTGDLVPIWVADYVLGGYGTGAVMAVPAHDQRDFEFAKQFDLPIQRVVTGGEGSECAHEGDGVICNWNGASGLDLDGMSVDAAKTELLKFLEENGLGTRRTNFKLRDWLFSRQRYWGEPFPIVFVNGHPQAVDESALPVTLPNIETYKPSGTGDSPLALLDDWVNTTTSTGEKAIRETNTMPQWAGSCWYYLRFIDPDNVGAPVDRHLENYWMPVDLYVGGVEHAVLHLLYARFWHKVLYDCGVVSTKEPFGRLVNQGMILGEVEYSGFKNASGDFVSAQLVDQDNLIVRKSGESVELCSIDAVLVEKDKDNFVLKDDSNVRLVARAHKMSKSRGNVVNPDSVIDEYGADALRCYLMFMGPLEQVKPWNANGVQGMARFLSRVWRLMIDPVSGELSELVVDDGESVTGEQLKVLHQTIKRVTEDTEGLRFNTALSAMMEFVNAANKWPLRPKEILRPFLILLSPYAPHVSEELWSRIGEIPSVSRAAWPELNEKYLIDSSKTIVVQVNGKVRHKLTVDAAAEKSFVIAAAKESESVQRYLDGKTIKKEIYVPGKLINLVVS